MRLAVVNLTSGGFSGGYRKYLSRLVPLLANDPRVSALSVFVPERAGIEMDPGIDVRTWPQSERNLKTLQRDLATRRPDVVFVPTARHLSSGSAPVVVMVRNMEPLEVPFGGNTWVEGLRNVARAWEARRACRRATRVIAVSDHVRRFIISRWHIDEDRIGTVYHGVDGGGPCVTAPRHSRSAHAVYGRIDPAGPRPRGRHSRVAAGRSRRAARDRRAGRSGVRRLCGRTAPAVRHASRRRSRDVRRAAGVVRDRGSVAGVGGVRHDEPRRSVPEYRAGSDELRFSYRVGRSSTDAGVLSRGRVVLSGCGR